MSARPPDAQRTEGDGETEEDTGLRPLQGPEGVGGLIRDATTVKTHVSRILAKLQLRDRVQAVVLAYETGLVRAGEDGSTRG